MKKNQKLKIHEKLWNIFFGPKIEALDFAQRIMKKDHHFNNKNADDPSAWNIDHIIPKKHGGKNSLDNIQLTNILTNREKSDNMNVFMTNDKYFQVVESNQGRNYMEELKLETKNIEISREELTKLIKLFTKEKNKKYLDIFNEVIDLKKTENIFLKKISTSSNQKFIFSEASLEKIRANKGQISIEEDGKQCFLKAEKNTWVKFCDKERIEVFGLEEKNPKFEFKKQDETFEISEITKIEKIKISPKLEGLDSQTINENVDFSQYEFVENNIITFEFNKSFVKENVITIREFIEFILSEFKKFSLHNSSSAKEGDHIIYFHFISQNNNLLNVFNEVKKHKFDIYNIFNTQDFLPFNTYIWNDKITLDNFLNSISFDKKFNTFFKTKNCELDNERLNNIYIKKQW